MGVLTTGAYGRFGTALVDHLGDRSEYDVTYLDRSDRLYQDEVRRIEEGDVEGSTASATTAGEAWDGPPREFLREGTDEDY
jgi:nucleoside-diphosphate-sugar epimerase